MTECAVILAGGQANRMGGVDKGRLMLGGQSLIQRVIDRIEPQVDAVVLNANGDLSRFDDLGLRSEEHTSELQSRPHLVCRLLLEKKKKKDQSKEDDVR